MSRNGLSHPSGLEADVSHEQSQPRAAPRGSAGRSRLRHSLLAAGLKFYDPQAELGRLHAGSVILTVGWESQRD